ncbi:NAD-dependent epimerase/dehydratase family protein [Apilactobacillus timberlakei]|uniref:NAD(P)H-binding protein n=1 Tax=Apilactobacillus timberlakei TaxID=2008380 RepID=UPI00112BE780|nr:NAD(P)H-binding protein [Apilactobacillus timberlakei]TPR23258.1 NAD-dependent epimerase/dehydratase family protein [Apilactobacillus timberlakei]
MKNILIIGATGNLGRKLSDQHWDENVNLTLLSRHAKNINVDKHNISKVNADIMNPNSEKYFANQDAVFVAISGNLSEMIKQIIKYMDSQNVKRIVFIASMGIYNEIPASIGAEGNVDNNPFLNDYLTAANLVAKSDLNYTILRPGWFDEGNDSFEITGQNEPFGGHDVSRNAIAQYAKKLLLDNDLHSKESIGINRPI